MALTVDIILHSAIILGSIQYCSAQCYGYCWYGSWYIWFAVVMILAICCGAVGSYFRRRQIRKAIRNQQAQIVTVDIIAGQNQTTTSDLGRPHVYPPGPPGAAPYPVNAVPAGGAAPYPTQQGVPPYPTGAQPYPVPGYPGAVMNAAPPYSAITSKDEQISALPPSYQEAVRDQGGYVNPAATAPEGDVTSGK